MCTCFLPGFSWFFWTCWCQFPPWYAVLTVSGPAPSSMSWLAPVGTPCLHTAVGRLSESSKRNWFAIFPCSFPFNFSSGKCKREDKFSALSPLVDFFPWVQCIQEWLSRVTSDSFLIKSELSKVSIAVLCAGQYVWTGRLLSWLLSFYDYLDGHAFLYFMLGVMYWWEDAAIHFC